MTAYVTLGLGPEFQAQLTALELMTDQILQACYTLTESRNSSLHKGKWSYIYIYLCTLAALLSRCHDVKYLFSFTAEYSASCLSRRLRV